MNRDINCNKCSHYASGVGYNTTGVCKLHNREVLDQCNNSCSSFRNRVETMEEKTTVQQDICSTLSNMSNLLVEKNKRYGNSALSPLNIFAHHMAEDDTASNSILVRLDDKLSRIRNANELRKNDVADIMGYLTLLCVNKGWTDFKELID